MFGKVLGAAAVCVVTVLCGGCGAPDAGPVPVRPVRAIKVGDLQVISGREFPGRAQAKDEVDLSFQISGPLVSLPVDVGSTVRKGEVVAAIDPRDFQAALDSAEGNLARSRANLVAMQRGARPEEIEQLKAVLEQAQASYQQADAEHQRNANLVDSGVVTKSEFDISLARKRRTYAEIKSAQEALNIGQKGARAEDIEAKQSEIRALEAAVVNAKNQLEYTVLSAPFDGEVAARYVDNFQTVQAKQPILRLLDVSKIEVTVQIPESLIALVPQVKEVACRFDALPNREFPGKITKIGSEASQTTRTYPVTVQIDQPEDVRILPGMAATIRGQSKANPADAGLSLAVPPGVIFADTAGEGSFVWVVEQGQKVVRRPVTLGKLTAVGREISEGLKPGELVVSTGVHSLQENQQVRILEEGSR